MLNQVQTPREIVGELDKYIIGQAKAKRSVAVALRNRYRRMQLDEKMQQDVTPKNILMIGPTGVGKTEIARRLAHIVQAPFIKVEATKFTEVGYVGRDVESMVRDLVENGIQIVKKQQYARVRVQAEKKANRRLVKALVPGIKKEQKKSTNPYEQMMSMFQGMQGQAQDEVKEELTDEIRSTRQAVYEQLEKGYLDQKEVTIEIDEPKVQMPSLNNGLEQMGIDLQETLGALKPRKKISRTLTVKEARELLINEESSKLVNDADIHSEALKLAETSGIIFIDEIDKITSKSKQSGEVSREGVQRDILPIVEGSQVNTKYGPIQTDHILFIASGAFHLSKPSDLIPELQGRFPIRVELDDLTAEDFVKILTEPNNALVKQYIALLATENIQVTFTKEAIEKIAQIAYQVNRDTDNIGARRLHTILERLLEDLLFEASDMQMGEITITESYVAEKLDDIAQDEDMSRYIL
ncbi:ATP-dependent protease ATPase subunit HslU [Enterococcus columbae]|uniref:ATP-dependent protease ATPase subunit HslU n=1 Tax=Enterococcus columbae DSM 7374 = ATCC 51263 TaxID=1121865 RepID=S1N617_9ENTE|nr:ATP-dependent protease ATPase subunit HslU [Enterococcus columbae]EOT44254.1 ATP-dependent protease ATPase subunit HslU [Enterococcus columbae DSM 7374 = ATCC 51263]EOW84412.1 ATP-dependent protease ATPase subunit HslU [Enterococcus columbae DSM 7374 = ATCC 51263]OJG26028.1 ATP-dependent protease ATPase subunit HslU [Enterococcus columbae DSM 7374 = ATCC 51263]